MCPSYGSDETSESEPERTTVDFHPQAIAELIEAAQFYEGRQNGLGTTFLNAVDNALSTIQMYPSTWQRDNQGRFRYRVKGFPHLLIYRLQGHHLFILAVAHTSRRPEYWQSRDRYGTPPGVSTHEIHEAPGTPRESTAIEESVPKETK
jgi:hypothetical protein